MLAFKIIDYNYTGKWSNKCIHTWIPALEAKASLGYTVSYRLAWARGRWFQNRTKVKLAKTSSEFAYVSNPGLYREDGIAKTFAPEIQYLHRTALSETNSFVQCGLAWDFLS